MHNIIQIVFNTLKVHLPLIYQMTDTYGTCKHGDMDIHGQDLNMNWINDWMKDIMYQYYCLIEMHNTKGYSEL